MAGMEHDRWRREREAAGWSLAPVKDLARKTSPYLAPFEDLPQDVKDKDRETVRAIPRFLARAGLRVSRAGADVPPGP